jgi:hypothetical protein
LANGHVTLQRDDPARVFRSRGRTWPTPPVFSRRRLAKNTVATKERTSPAARSPSSRQDSLTFSVPRLTTINSYESILKRHVVPGMGELRVREATVMRLDRFFGALQRTVGASTAKTARTAL